MPDSLPSNTHRAAIFRTYSSEEFIAWSPWKELEDVLKTNGGAYGFSGARGSGKTWLMKHAVHFANEKGGIGLWLPSPSNYEAQAFMSAIVDTFGNAIHRKFKWNQRGMRVYFSPLIGFGIAILLAVISTVLISGHLDDSQYIYNTMYRICSITLVVIAYVISTVCIYTLKNIRSTPMVLCRKISLLLNRIRYSESLKDTKELSASGGSKGLFKLLTSRELLER